MRLMLFCSFSIIIIQCVLGILPSIYTIARTSLNICYDCDADDDYNDNYTTLRHQCIYIIYMSFCLRRRVVYFKLEFLIKKYTIFAFIINIVFFFPYTITASSACTTFYNSLCCQIIVLYKTTL